MQLGMVGLGRMGANIVRRLMRDGHECVVYDVNEAAIAALEGEGAIGARDAGGLRRQARRAARGLGHGARRVHRRHGRQARRRARRGRHHHRRRQQLLPRRHRARPRRSSRKGIHYVDVGTSGGVFGLERGFCLMIGGEDEIVHAPRPDLPDASRPAWRRAPRTPGRDRRARPPPSTATCTAARHGAGHFVKMVHNGIEYGIMAAYAEGLNDPPPRRRRGAGARAGRRDDAAARPRVLPVRDRHPGGRRGLAARQRRRLLAAGPDGQRAGRLPDARGVRRPGVGLR